MDRLFTASVVDNSKLISDHFLLTLNPSKKIMKPIPGTFFMISVDKGFDPLLKRPFSLHRWLGGSFQILYRVVGKGSLILSRRKPGDMLDVLGPLGNGFTLIRNKTQPLLVAGGLGIAPVFALAESIRKKYKTSPMLFYGARTGKDVLCINELDSIGINPVISTDDGTFGMKGNIVNVLKKHLTSHSSPADDYSLFACGPEPMLKSLSLFAQKKKLKGFLALEQHMACGLGTCLGCVVNTVNGYKRVCKEGPVFPIEEIAWK